MGEIDLDAFSQKRPPHWSDLFTLADRVCRYQSGPDGVVGHVVERLLVPARHVVQGSVIVGTPNAHHIRGLGLGSQRQADKRRIAHNEGASFGWQCFVPVHLQSVRGRDFGRVRQR